MQIAIHVWMCKDQGDLHAMLHIMNREWESNPVGFEGYLRMLGIYSDNVEVIEIPDFKIESLSDAFSLFTEDQLIQVYNDAKEIRRNQADRHILQKSMTLEELRDSILRFSFSSKNKS